MCCENTKYFLALCGQMQNILKNELKNGTMEKLKRVKNGYKIDFTKIEDGYLTYEIGVSADNFSKARSLLLDKIKYDSWKLKYTEEDVSFINIPVVRCKAYDTFEFEGQELQKYEIERIIARRKRFAELDAILDDLSVDYCYIMKRGVYYKPNNCGYTQRKADAGVYTKFEAVSDAKSCEDLFVIPINIEEHNAIICAEIEKLTEKLIKI